MSTKEFVKPFGATTATTIRLTQPYHGSGCRVIADSWFGSVKCARITFYDETNQFRPVTFV